MPKSRTSYTVFISAPSDVSAEVEVVKQTVADVNLLVRSLGVEFETFHWVDDVTPGATENAQGRINAQADGYDIIVAMFGSKLGTPTEGYESGTVEEIEISLANKVNLTFEDDSVIVLFKHLQIDASYGDLEAAAKVQKYRKSLSGRVLYKEFESESDLKDYLLKALSPVLARHLDDGSSPNLGEPLGEGSGSKPPEGLSPQEGEEAGGSTREMVLTQPTATSAHHMGDDLGFLDFVERAELGVQDATQSAHKIGSAVKDIAARFDAVTEEIAKGADVQDRAVITRIMSDISTVMESAASDVEREAEAMQASFVLALDYLESALEIQVHDFNNVDDGRAVVEMSASVYDSVLLSMSEIGNFRAVLSSTPRMNQQYNRAKLKLLRAIYYLSESMQVILNRSSELSANASAFIKPL